MAASQNEIDAQLQIEIIRAKASIAVSILSNANIMGMVSDNRTALLDYVKEAQKTVEE